MIKEFLHEKLELERQNFFSQVIEIIINDPNKEVFLSFNECLQYFSEFNKQNYSI